MIRLSLALAGGALVAFHGWLFAVQMADGRLDDPWLVLRWITAALLAVALIAARRSESASFGRNAVAIWVLAALLHGPAISDLHADFNSFALPETVATTIVQLVSSSALGAGLLLLAAVLFPLRRRAAIHDTMVPAFVHAGGRASEDSRPFAPRPPPVRRGR